MNQARIPLAILTAILMWPSTALGLGATFTGTGDARPPMRVDVERWFGDADGARGYVPRAPGEWRETPEVRAGEIEIRWLVPGERYRITLADGDGRTAVLVENPFVGAGDVVVRRADWTGPVRLRGTVRDRQGDPIPDAMVIATPLPGNRANIRQAHAACDAGGRFELPSPPFGEQGTALRAAAPGFTFADVELEAPGATPPSELEIVLDRSASIVGRVHGMSSEDPPQRIEATVWLDTATARLRTRAAPDGSFAFDDVPAGPVDVSLLDPREDILSPGPPDPERTQSLDLEPGEVARVAFDYVRVRPADLTVTCVDGAGRPVAEARVRVLKRNGFERELATGDHGRARFPGLVPGRYALAVAPPACGFAGPRQGLVEVIDLSSDLEIARAVRTGTLRIALARGSEGGHPVFVRPRHIATGPARFEWLPGGDVEVGDPLVLAGLPTGTYEVEWECGERRGRCRPVGVTDGGATSLEIDPFANDA